MIKRLAYHLHSVFGCMVEIKADDICLVCFGSRKFVCELHFKDIYIYEFVNGNFEYRATVYPALTPIMFSRVCVELTQICDVEATDTLYW